MARILALQRSGICVEFLPLVLDLSITPPLNFCDLIDKFLYVHEDFRNEIFAVTT